MKNVFSEKSTHKKSPLLDFVSWGLTDAVEEIFENDGNEINVNETDKLGTSAAHIAAERNDFPMLKLLRKHGACLDATDYRSRTPAGWAQRNKNAEMVEYIRQNSANCKGRNDSNNNNETFTPFNLKS